MLYSCIRTVETRLKRNTRVKGSFQNFAMTKTWETIETWGHIPAQAVLDAAQCFRNPHMTHDMSKHGATRRPGQSVPLFRDTGDLYAENQYRHSNHLHPCHSNIAGTERGPRFCIHGNEKVTFTSILVGDTFIYDGDGKWFKRTAEFMRWKVRRWVSRRRDSALEVFVKSNLIYTKVPEILAPEGWKCAFFIGQQSSTKCSSCTRLPYLQKGSSIISQKHKPSFL